MAAPSSLYGYAMSYTPTAKKKPPVKAAPKPQPKAAPVPVRALAPVTDAQLQAQADERVNAALAALAAPITTAQGNAVKQATADQSAIQGLGAAGAGLAGQIGPQIQAAYGTAAQGIGALAGGFSAEAAQRVRDSHEANRQFVEGQVGVAGAPPVDANALQDVMYQVGGFIPGSSLEQQGAAAGRWGASLPAIQGIQTQQDLLASQAQAGQQSHEYEQQLIDLATKRPEMRATVIDALYKLELDKLNSRLDQQKFAEDKRAAHVQEQQQGRQIGVQERAQNLYEQQFTETARHNQANESLDYASLQLRNQTQQASLDKEAAKGRQIDAAGSKVRGFVIDKQGHFVLDESGKKIPVKAGGAAPKDRQKVYGDAVLEAKSLRGNPLDNKEPLPGEGLYIARVGAKGVFPKIAGRPRTTNNPRLAQYDAQMSFVEAQTFLMNRYGLTRAKARQALVSSGWKPDGKRPKG